ncbi:hypothetical protein [Desulfitobacterium sp.]
MKFHGAGDGVIEVESLSTREDELKFLELGLDVGQEPSLSTREDELKSN